MSNEAVPRRLVRPERLRRAEDVRAVLRRRRAGSGCLVAVHRRRRDDDGPPRATVVAGRKVGNAVARNRAKRRLRAALAEVGVPAGTDVVLVARPSTGRAPFARLRTEVAELVEGGEARAGRS